MARGLSAGLVLLVVVVSKLNAEALSPGGLSSADVLRMARQNARTAPTLRIRWSIERGRTSQARRYYAATADRLAGLVKSGEIPASDADEAHRAEISNRARADDARTESAVLEYWTDFESFQMQALQTESGAPFAFRPPSLQSFPDKLLSGAELRERWPSILVLSHGPATEARFRAWQARPQPPYFATVALRSPWLDVWHAPLVFPEETWGGIAHPIDKFFWMLDGGRANVIGEAVIDDRRLLLVYVERDDASMRAFVDLNAGAIPRRIEVFNGKVPTEFGRDFLGPCENHPQLTAGEIVRDIVIDQFEAPGDQVFHYPTAGIVCELSRTANPADAISSAQPEVAVHRTATWKVDLVECGREMDPADFALRFPPGTIFVDEGKQATFLTGDIDGEVTRIVDGVILASSSSRWRSMAIIAMTLLALAVIVWGGWRLRRRQVISMGSPR